MDYRGFMNALKLYGQFGVCDYVHIALKKVSVFMNFSNRPMTHIVGSLGLFVSTHSLGMPLSPCYWVPEYCHFSTLYIAFSPQFIDPGVDNHETSSLPGGILKETVGEEAREKRQQEEIEKGNQALFALWASTHAM